VIRERFPSIKNYIQRLDLVNNKSSWKLGSSSDSLPISSISVAGSNSYNQHPEPSPIKTSGANRIIKKRTSWGINGFKATSVWNERMSELFSDLYVNSVYNYCDAKCRMSSNGMACADNCKYVKTNCKNFSKPTNCLRNVKGNSESSDTSDSL
jgi:hypothetical protein